MGLSKNNFDDAAMSKLAAQAVITSVTVSNKLNLANGVLSMGTQKINILDYNALTDKTGSWDVTWDSSVPAQVTAANLLFSQVKLVTQEDIAPYTTVRGGSIAAAVGTWQYTIVGKICFLQLAWTSNSYTLANNNVLITVAQLTAANITPRNTGAWPAGVLNTYVANWGKMGTISVGSNTGVQYGGDTFTGNIMGNAMFPIA
jgi:hypothetical protein